MTQLRPNHLDQVKDELLRHNSINYGHCDDSYKNLYDAKRSLFYCEIEKLLTYKDSIDVLDFGSGKGELSLDIKKQFGERVCVWGYENSPCAHVMALKHNQLHEEGVNFFLDESGLFDYTMGHRVFDIIVSSNFCDYASEPIECFKSFRKVLKPNGLLVIFGDMAPISIYSNFELANFLKNAGFSRVDVYPFYYLHFGSSNKTYLKQLKKTGSKFYYLYYVFSLFEFSLPLGFSHLLKLKLGRLYDDQSDSSGCFIKAKS